MKALLVGAGGMGRAWGRNLTANPDVTLAGWADVRPGVAAEAAAELDNPSIITGTDLSQLIDQIAPDFVVDVTPPEVHHDVTLLALSRGLPVLGEKPMASSMEEARRMVEASEQAGKLYMVSQSRRYLNGMIAYRRLIERELGRLGILNVDFYIGAHFGGFRDEMDHPLVLDMAIHTFDQARYLCGEDPVSVYAEEFNPSWSWYKGDVCANAIFEMSNGLRFTYRGSWCAEGLSTSWEGDWRAVGEKGSARWSNQGEPTAEIVRSTTGFMSEVESATEPLPSEPEGIAGSLAEFVDALRTGSMPQGECHDNIKSLAMVFGAIESSKTGMKVRI